MVPKVFLGYEKAFWLKKMEISNASQIWTNKVHILGSFLEYLITTVKNSTKKPDINS